MLKELFEKILSQARPEYFDYAGRKFTTHDLNELKPHIAKPIYLSTLTSLVEYIKESVDKDQLFEIIDITDHDKVVLKSGYLEDFRRHTFAEVQCEVPQIGFNSFHDLEAFNIMLVTRFKLDKKDNRGAILGLAKNYQEEHKAETTDDGVSQKVVVKKGVELGTITIPNPIELQPRRTFLEVDQPITPFIFRVREGGNMALFEADGGAWRLQAKYNIKAYLEKELDGLNIAILA